MATLSTPVVLALNALYPNAVLLLDVDDNNDSKPQAVLLVPVWFDANELVPIAVFPVPVVLEPSDE
jgi:hypothetical protein